MVIVGNEVIDLNLKTPWGDRIIKLRKACSVSEYTCNTCSYNDKCESINVAPLIELNNLLCDGKTLMDMCYRIDIDLLGLGENLKEIDTYNYIPEPNTFEENIPELFNTNNN